MKTSPNTAGRYEFKCFEPFKSGCVNWLFELRSVLLRQTQNPMLTPMANSRRVELIEITTIHSDVIPKIFSSTGAERITISKPFFIQHSRTNLRKSFRLLHRSHLHNDWHYHIISQDLCKIPLIHSGNLCMNVLWKEEEKMWLCIECRRDLFAMLYSYFRLW